MARNLSSSATRTCQEIISSQQSALSKVAKAARCKTHREFLQGLGWSEMRSHGLSQLGRAVLLGSHRRRLESIIGSTIALIGLYLEGPAAGKVVVNLQLSGLQAPELESQGIWQHARIVGCCHSCCIPKGLSRALQSRCAGEPASKRDCRHETLPLCDSFLQDRLVLVRHRPLRQPCPWLPSPRRHRRRRGSLPQGAAQTAPAKQTPPHHSAREGS